MSQPAPHPHHVSQLFGPALGGIIHALADRGEQTAAEYQARADDAWTLVQSFQPRDTIDLMLTGQFISMNELFADTSRDILRGMPDSEKQRARSSVVAMGRLALAQVDELERRGIQPYRTELAEEQRPSQAAEAQAAQAPAANAPAAEPAEKPQAATVAMPASSATAASLPTSSEPAPPGEEPCWVDEPYQEWLEATPAMRAAAAAMISTENIPSPVPREAAVSGGTSSAFDLPHQHAAHRHAEAMSAAAD